MIGWYTTSIADQFFQALRLAHGAGDTPYCWPAGLPVSDAAGAIPMGDEGYWMRLPDNSKVLQKFN